MKNIKRFQNTVCQEEKLNNHVEKLIQTVKSNNDSVSALFSGILSSFVSDLLFNTLQSTIPIVRTVIVIAAFFVSWYVFAKWLVPNITNWLEQRRVSNIDELSKQEVVGAFNSAITLSAIEINDAINIMKHEEHDKACKKINAIIIVNEYIKCINYVVNNVNKKHIRLYNEKADKLPCNYINYYSLVLVYKLLYDSGIQLKEYFYSINHPKENILLIIYDLDDVIKTFFEHIQNIGVSDLVFEDLEKK